VISHDFIKEMNIEATISAWCSWLSSKTNKQRERERDKRGEGKKEKNEGKEKKPNSTWVESHRQPS
jgi:hypothetical protein